MNIASYNELFDQSDYPILIFTSGYYTNKKYGTSYLYLIFLVAQSIENASDSWNISCYATEKVLHAILYHVIKNTVACTISNTVESSLQSSFQRLCCFLISCINIYRRVYSQGSQAHVSRKRRIDYLFIHKGVTAV